MPRLLEILVAVVVKGQVGIRALAAVAVRLEQDVELALADQRRLTVDSCTYTTVNIRHLRVPANSLR